MKEKNSVIAYEDEAYHIKVKKDLETARLACQRLLDTWNGLDLGTVTDMDELQINPEKCYDRELEKLIPIPEDDGRFPLNKGAIIADYVAKHHVTNSAELYKVAKETRKVLYCSVPGLFLTDGKTVTLDEQIANFYITMNDVFVTNPEKIALAAEMKEWIERTNSLNRRMNFALFDSASPVTNRFVFGKCEFLNTDARGSRGDLSWKPAYMREVLK